MEGRDITTGPGGRTVWRQFKTKFAEFDAQAGAAGGRGRLEFDEAGFGEASLPIQQALVAELCFATISRQTIGVATGSVNVPAPVGFAFGFGHPLHVFLFANAGHTGSPNAYGVRQIWLGLFGKALHQLGESGNLSFGEADRWFYSDFFYRLSRSLDV